MGEVITIGLDIAKSVFQVHGVDGAGAVVIGNHSGKAGQSGEQSARTLSCPLVSRIFEALHGQIQQQY
jgi:hypothetical protein